MSIRQKLPPNLIGQPSVNLKLQNFESPIWQKGYDVIIEKAIRCPCKSNNGAIPTCQNCKGSGWTFINPYRTRAILSSINAETKYKDWSVEKLGTINVTVRDGDGISYFDKIILENDFSTYSERLNIRYDTDNNKIFVFTSYPISEIEEIYLYQGDTSPLIRLDNLNDVSIKPENPYVLIINYDTSTITNFNNKLSIRYKHKIQYNIIDLPHDTRKSYKVNNLGADERVLLPIQGIARRTHNIEVFADVPDYDGTGTIDNTYL